MQIEFGWRQIFEIFTIHKPSPGSRNVPISKFGPIRFSRFDVYWIQTNKQTDKQSIYEDYMSEIRIYTPPTPIYI